MNKEREDLTNKPVEAEFSLDFSPDGNEKSEKPEAVSVFKKHSKWQNALAAAAIAAIAVLHFFIQTSFIRSEAGKTLNVDEVSVQIEQTPAEIPKTEPDIFEAKKISDVAVSKPVPMTKPRHIEIVPPKPQTKKKITVETREMRLRRAEQILTGF